MKDIAKSIEQFLEMARERKFSVSGNATDSCLVINGLKLDSRFNVPETNVMIRFRPESNDAIILLPKDVAIRPDAGLSSEFIEPVDNPEGWNCVFPNTFLNVDGDIFEVVFSVAGALANLSLYNLVSPNPITRSANAILVEATRVQNNSPENG
jgi:hypothetical protein